MKTLEHNDGEYLNIFETNDLSNIKSIKFEDTKIYYMDNFYKYPNLVVKYLNSIEPSLMKSYEVSSKNMVDFEDRRHKMDIEELNPVYQKLSNLCGQKRLEEPTLSTNYCRFKKCPNNNYRDNYWWPHIDLGYNGIIYLNNYGEEEYEGTYLYKQLNKNLIISNEHADPWSNRKNWNVVFKIKAKYNRFAMFEGSKYFHGMSIFDDRWFADNLEEAEYRITQVLFFKRNHISLQYF